MHRNPNVDIYMEQRDESMGEKHEIFSMGEKHEIFSHENPSFFSTVDPSMCNKSKASDVLLNQNINNIKACDKKYK